MKHITIIRTIQKHVGCDEKTARKIDGARPEAYEWNGDAYQARIPDPTRLEIYKNGRILANATDLR